MFQYVGASFFSLLVRFLRWWFLSFSRAVPLTRLLVVLLLTLFLPVLTHWCFYYFLLARYRLHLVALSAPHLLAHSDLRLCPYCLLALSHQQILLSLQACPSLFHFAAQCQVIHQKLLHADLIEQEKEHVDYLHQILLLHLHNNLDLLLHTSANHRYELVMKVSPLNVFTICESMLQAKSSTMLSLQAIPCLLPSGYQLNDLIVLTSLQLSLLLTNRHQHHSCQRPLQNSLLPPSPAYRWSSLLILLFTHIHNHIVPQSTPAHLHIPHHPPLKSHCHPLSSLRT